MKKSKSTATIRELAQRFGLSRDTVAKVLEPLQFKVGPNRAHLFNRKEAQRLLTEASSTSAEMRRLRLEKLQAEAELAKQKAADYAKSHITIDQHSYIMETFWKAIVNAYRERSEDNYPEQVRTEFYVDAAITRAMEDMNFPLSMIRERQENLHRRQGQFDLDVKAGRVPTFWAAEGTTYDDEKGYRVFTCLPSS